MENNKKNEKYKNKDFKRAIRDLNKKIINTCFQINSIFYEETNGNSTKNYFIWPLAFKTKIRDKIESICIEYINNDKNKNSYNKALTLAEIMVFEEQVFSFELRSKLNTNIPKTFALINTLKKHLENLKNQFEILNKSKLITGDIND